MASKPLSENIEQGRGKPLPFISETLLERYDRLRMFGYSVTNAQQHIVDMMMLEERLTRFQAQSKLADTLNHRTCEKYRSSP